METLLDRSPRPLTPRAAHLLRDLRTSSQTARHQRAAEYLSAVDVSDERQRTRLLHVFDDLLAREPLNEYVANEQREMRRLLKRDGIQFEGDEIAGDQLRMPEQDASRLRAALPDFSSVTDVEILREHARRMQRASVNADAADAILAARELLESVCKLICDYYSVAVPKDPNAGELYKLAAGLIGLDAQDVPESDPGAAASRKGAEWPGSGRGWPRRPEDPCRQGVRARRANPGAPAPR